MTEDEVLLVERRGPVEWVTLNRPDRLNALNSRLIDALADYFRDVAKDSAVRVIVLRGSGRGFCAGLDLKAQFDGDDAGNPRLPELIVSLRQVPQPVIALVHGAACGGGFAMALAADVRIAGESARMNDAFVKIGVSGCELGMSYFLPRYVGLSVASDLMLTGRFIEADRAAALGLVSEVVSDDQLEKAGEALAGEMLRLTPIALRKTKETLARIHGIDDLATVVEIEQLTQESCLRDIDNFEEAIRAFNEKREPRFV